MDDLHDRFEKDWVAGNPPALEEVVRSVPESARLEAFWHLLNIECEYRTKAGHPLAMVEARERFQGLGPWAEGIIGELLGGTGSWTGPERPVPPAGDPPAPRNCLGRYELLTKLGGGACGTVFKARHTQLQQLVALKVLVPHRALTPGGLERFRREMVALGQLSHPHIIRATDAGEAQGHFYLAMEHVAGVDLGHVLKKVVRLGVSEACEIVRQAAEALAYIDQRGMVHRDIKPSNLLLGRDGIVRVLDLGLAHLRDVPPGETLTETGAVMGTPEYIAPEQTRESREVDIRADVYGLGCTFFALLAGSPPFARGGSIYDLFRAHNETPPPAIGTVRDGVPPELERLILRMLEKEPALRPTPEEIVRTLRPYCEGSNLARLLEECGPGIETPVVLPPAFARVVFDDAETGSRPPTERTTPVVFQPPRPVRRRMKRWVPAAAALALGVLGWAVWPSKKAHTGQEPERTPTTTPQPKSVPPIAPRRFAPDEWTELLDRAPMKRIWPEKDPRSRFEYDPTARQLFVDCTDYGLLELGSIEAEAYDVEVIVFQNTWSLGRVGVFVRGRQPPNNPKVAWEAETLFLQTLPPPGQTNTRADLGLGEVKVGPAGGLGTWQRVSYGVPRPTSGDHTLSFIVGRTAVKNVGWDGKDTAPLEGMPPERTAPATGSLGVIVQNSNALFRSIRVRPHPPSGVQP